MWNAGEPPLQNIDVTLVGDADGDGSIETLKLSTDPFGHYQFTGLAPGSYTVTVSASDPELPPGSVITTAGGYTVALAAGEIYLAADYGFRVPPAGAAIGDLVWNDWNGNGVLDPGEPGIEGVTIELWEGGALAAQGATDAVGHYLFEGLSAGTYQVRVTDANGVLAGHTHTLGPDSKPLPFDRALSDGEVYLGADFGYWKKLPLSSIGDYVWVDLDGDGVRDPGEQGITGVTIDLRDQYGVTIATATTDVYGYYSFSGLPAGTYVVVVTDTGGVLGGYDPTTPTTVTHVLGAQEAFNGANFGYLPKWPDPQLGSIGDTIWYDLQRNRIVDPGEAGIKGVKVRLRSGSGAVIAAAATDALGHYLFPSLPAAAYTVDVDESTVPPGNGLTTANNPLPVALGAGEHFVFADFGYAPIVTPSPTPTPSSCDSVILDLGRTTASPGDMLSFFGCVPYLGGRMLDAYLVVITPQGAAYSILYSGEVVRGIVAYYRGFAVPSDCFCMTLAEHMVCPVAPLGTYEAIFAVLPHGASPTRANIISYATWYMTVTASKTF